MAYSNKVIDHYNDPKNVGSFTKDEEGVGTGLVGAPECGDVMKLQIKVEKDRIVDAKFKTFGCGSAIASSSLATEWVKGKSVDEAMAIENTEIVEELSLPPVKIHCSVLAEDAIKAAINDYKNRNGLESPKAWFCFFSFEILIISYLEDKVRNYEIQIFLFEYRKYWFH